MAVWSKAAGAPPGHLVFLSGPSGGRPGRISWGSLHTEDVNRAAVRAELQGRPARRARGTEGRPCRRNDGRWRRGTDRWFAGSLVKPSRMFDLGRTPLWRAGTRCPGSGSDSFLGERAFFPEGPRGWCRTHARLARAVSRSPWPRRAACRAFSAATQPYCRAPPKPNAFGRCWRCGAKRIGHCWQTQRRPLSRWLSGSRRTARSRRARQAQRAPTGADAPPAP